MLLSQLCSPLVYVQFDILLPLYTLDETHKYFFEALLLFFKSRGALGQLFEIAGPPSAAQH